LGFNIISIGPSEQSGSSSMFMGTFCTFLSGFSRGDRGDELVPRTPRAPFHMSGLGGRLQTKMTLFPWSPECRTRARDERFLFGAWRPAKTEPALRQIHNMRQHHNTCYLLRSVVQKRARVLVRFVTCVRKRRHVAAGAPPTTTYSPGTGPCCTFPCCYKPMQHSTRAHQ